MLASLRLPDGGIYAFPWKTQPGDADVQRRPACGSRRRSARRRTASFVTALRRLARDTDGDGRLDRWGFWAPLKTTWYERFYDFYPLYLASSGGRTLVAHGEVDLRQRRRRPRRSRSCARRSPRDLLPRSNFALAAIRSLDGTVAMKIIGPWFLHELEQLKVPGLRYDVAPVPAPDDVGALPEFAFADLQSIAIFSTTRHAGRGGALRRLPHVARGRPRCSSRRPSQLPYRRAARAAIRVHARPRRAGRRCAVYARIVERTRDIDLDPRRRRDLRPPLGSVRSVRDLRNACRPRRRSPGCGRSEEDARCALRRVAVRGSPSGASAPC